MFVDTHCHLNMIVKKERYTLLCENEFLLIEQVIAEAREQKVEKIITVGTNRVESLNAIEIAKKFDGVFASIGLHPCDCTVTWKDDFEQIKKLVKEKETSKIVAIGETGLDFFHKPYNQQRQIDAFRSHIELALQNNLPIIVHVRDSVDQIINVLSEYKNKVKGVIHCFMRPKEIADIFLDWGFYLGINAPITYPKNEWFKSLLKDIPIGRILLETDAPFLPPQQFRGKQNRPAYIPIFAKIIADIKGIDLAQLEKVTTKNVQALFGI